jgi:hypothetical protein
MSRKRKRRKDKKGCHVVFLSTVFTRTSLKPCFLSPFTLLSAPLLSVSRLSLSRLSLPVRLRTCGNPTSSRFWGSFVALQCLFAAWNCAGNICVIFWASFCFVFSLTGIVTLEGERERERERIRVWWDCRRFGGIWVLVWQEPYLEQDGGSGLTRLCAVRSLSRSCTISLVSVLFCFDFPPFPLSVSFFACLSCMCPF